MSECLCKAACPEGRRTFMKYDRLDPSASSASIFVLMAQKLAPWVATQRMRVPGGRAFVAQLPKLGLLKILPNRVLTIKHVLIYFGSLIHFIFWNGRHYELWIHVRHLFTSLDIASRTKLQECKYPASLQRCEKVPSYATSEGMEIRSSLHGPLMNSCQSVD
jgi:hypothetical protein